MFRPIVWKYIVLISMLFVAACSKTADTGKSAQPLAPTLDLSTPDRALKSYWAQKDWLTVLARLEMEPSGKRNITLFKDQMPRVTTGHVAEYYLSQEENEQPRQLHREIISVKQETDSRAIALVRITNITSIPSGVEPSKKDLDERKKGREFSYLIEREAKEWKVAEVIQLSDSKYIEPVSLYRKREPSVPSFVYFD